MLRAASHTEGYERAFLRLMGLGMVARLAGNSLWSASHLFGFGIFTPVAPQDIAYASPLRRALPDRQLAREVVGSRHDPVRPHVNYLPRGSLSTRKSGGYSHHG